MPDPASFVWLGLPARLWLALMTGAAFGAFGARVWRYVKVARSGRPEPRWDHPFERLGRVALHVLAGARLLEERLIGAAHLVIFWAFLIYGVSFAWNWVRALFPALPIPYPDEVGWMAAALLVFGWIGLVAVVVAACRRTFAPPAGLERSTDAGFILLLITTVLASAIAGQGARGVAPTAAAVWWWVHMITVLAFLAYLPYSKHLHLIAAPFGVFFGALDRTAMPASSEGAIKREEFTWRQLMCGLTCAECGRCERACPVNHSGVSFSPKVLMEDLRKMVRTPEGYSLDPAVAWLCTTCRACMDRCPVFNEHIPILIEMRRRMVNEGQVSATLQEALERFGRYGNSFGASPRARPKWSEQLAFKIKDARKEPVEYLWFVGDYASLDPRVQLATQAFARLLHGAGIDFGILYDQERNSGNDVRRAGEEGLFEMLREQNQRALAKAQYSKIVTTDPHTYHALKNEYGNGHVVHSSELLAELLVEDRLRVKPLEARAVTYQDPCYLGRYNNIFEAPRSALTLLGYRLAEMPRHGSRAWCCGAGGGRIWMEDPPGVRERPAESRVREAAALDGVDTLVVCCPKDLVMFQDALKTTGLEQKLAVRDLAQVAEPAIAPAGG